MDTDNTAVEDIQESSIWPITIWSDIRAAADEVGKGAERLNDLLLKYQQPLRIFLLARFRAFPQVTKRADELLQDFASDKILAQGWLKKANSEKGRFRSWLKMSLKNYVINRVAKADCGISLEQLAEEGIEPKATDPVENGAFELKWVQAVIHEALGRLEMDCKAPTTKQPHNSHIWEVFRLRILDPIFKGTQPAPYEQLVKVLGLRSPTEGSNLLLTAKNRFKALLKGVMAGYSGSNQVAESELRELAEFVEHLAKAE
jgi:hypothetical protein